MKNFLRALILVYAGCIYVAFAYPPQFLRNGSFDDIPLKGVASGWRDNSGWADVKVQYSADKANAHAGWAQKIVSSDFRSGAVQFLQSGLAVSKGIRYEVRVWLRGDVSSPVEILLRKRGSPYTTYISRAFKVTSEWKEYSFPAASLADDSDVYFIIQFTSAGTLWIDDASFRSVDVRVAPIAAEKGNYLDNGSFESGLDRWGIQIREFGDYEHEASVELTKREPEVVRDKAQVGRRSLKISIPKHGMFTLTSPYVKVTTGRKYSLSLWMAADKARDVRIGLASNLFRPTDTNSNVFAITGRWKRYSMSVMLPPADEDAYFAVVESNGEGVVWVDGVQLEEGEVSPFKPKSLIEIGLQREGVPVLYRVGDSIKLSVLISSFDTPIATAVSIKSIDYYGRSIDLLGKNENIKPLESHTIEFAHPSAIPGYYKIVAEVKGNGSLMDTSEMAIAILPADIPEPFAASPFGNHVKFNARNLEQARRLGVSWLRMHPPLATKWAVVEKDRTKFVFNDEGILLAKSLGLNILGSLDTSPRWASQVPAENADEFRAYPPKDMKDWETYVYKTVEHYKGIIDYWEVWNEPDGNQFLKVHGSFGRPPIAEVYTELLKVAYRAAKRANPNATIVGGVANREPLSQWFAEIFSRGAYPYMDIPSFHGYTDGWPDDALPVSRSVHIDELKALMRKQGDGTEKPIWETESGVLYPETAYGNIRQVSSGYHPSPRDSAAYVVRHYVSLLSRGVSKWFYYSMMISHRIDRSEATGFFEWDGSPRALAVAYANLVRFIGKTKFDRMQNLGSEVSASVFSDDDRVVIVLWAKGWGNDKKVETSLENPTPYRNITIYNIMGETILKLENQRTLKILVTNEPRYIVFSK
ncbi:MAG: carbohydrate binding domain-containing protein [Dehalococcoidales bacterium]|nr:carbohydrate binding domain-containing protein [Dehalococcoidales bacterium]